MVISTTTDCRSVRPYHGDVPRATTTSSAAERSAATREKIVAAARELVLERGYAGLSTAAVLKRAGVSRGGLYHHFTGKANLIAAVLEAVEIDLLKRLANAVAAAPDAFSALKLGAQWYLDECLRSPELQRAGLHEGRKALGWETWRETIEPLGLATLEANLRAAQRAGQIHPADPRALAHLILAMLHEAATVIFTAPDPATERDRVATAVATVINGLGT